LNFNAKDYNKSLKRVQTITKNGIDKVLKDYKLDALVAPGNNFNIISLLAIAGYPGIIVLAGYDKSGVPFGICFGGGRGSEPTLIKISYDFERATKIRKIPMYKI
jgi:amidase